MADQFYYLDKNEQFGPFELDEFRNFYLPAKTMVWKTGLKDWVTADQLDELKDQFTAVPPPIPNISQRNQQQFRTKIQENPVKKFFRIFLGIVFSIVALVCLAGFISTNGKAIEAIVLAIVFALIAVVLFVAKPKSGKAKYNNKAAVDGMLFAQTMYTADAIMDDNIGDFDSGGWDDGGADFD